MSARQDDAAIVRIARTRGVGLPNAREVWRSRDLLYFLIVRDLKVRYKQTAIGVAWVILQPLTTLIVFSVVLGRLADVPSEGLPYAVFAVVGLAPWQLFSRTLADASGSLLADQRLITRVYFPRLIVPTSMVAAALADFGAAALLVAAVMAVYGVAPSANIVWLPCFLALMLMTVLGVGYWLSALYLEFRDVRYAVPFLTQVWLFATPVVYPASLVPDRWQLVYALNPLVGVVEGFRWSVLGSGAGPDASLAVSVAVAAAIFLSGVLFFDWRERTFVDAVGSGGR
ncbi:MAG: ABC transporter permease [Chloroflexota bacterium]|nr:ABC transporter permease [Chloroflexota bacterium]